MTERLETGGVVRKWYYKLKAVHALKLAQAAEDSEMKAHWLTLAAQWQRLGDGLPSDASSDASQEPPHKDLPYTGTPQDPDVSG